MKEESITLLIDRQRNIASSQLLVGEIRKTTTQNVAAGPAPESRVNQSSPILRPKLGAGKVSLHDTARAVDLKLEASIVR